MSLRELWRGQVVADADVAGPGTQLSGALALSPWQVSAREWSGRAAAGLLALAPGLPALSCSMHAVVAVDRLALRRRSVLAEGTVQVAEGTCTDESGGEHPVPAMVLGLSTEGPDARAVLATADAAATPLASLTVTADRRLLIRIEPDGALLVPGMPSSAATTLEYWF
jgi:hypothetical protein